MNKTLETNRTYLRPYIEGDGPMLYATGIRNHDHLQEFESDNYLLHLKNEQHAESVIQEFHTNSMAGNYYLMGIFDKNTGNWCGQIYVETTNSELPEFEIGFVADVNHEGLGYISEAVNCILEVLFVDNNAKRVKGECSEYNIRSWHLFERLGFKRENNPRHSDINTNTQHDGNCTYILSRQQYMSN